MPDEAEVDEELIEVLRETDLLKFQTVIVFDKQLTRIEHFQDVTDTELKSYGLSEPAVRRLRNAIDRKKKKRTKIFGGAKREKTLVRLKRETAIDQNGAMLPSSTPHLIAKSEVQLKEILGEGNFSVVRRAIWSRTDGEKRECAVKVLHGMSEAIPQDLASEISIMQNLRHQNLVQLFGVIFSEQIMMVVELCEGGSLLNRLRTQSKTRLLVTTLLNYAQQIVNGMGFLESRKCLHRDLATRNVFLTHQEQVVKIGDFGLTRILKDNEHLYIMSEPKKIPFSWSPPESLRFRQFSHKSDVWAFGVTLWELFTFGEEPWAGHRASEVLELIEAGKRLRMPAFCPREIYDIMQLCWQQEAEKRPTFLHLRALLNDCKFMTMICREQNVSTSANISQLDLSVGDELILMGQRDGFDDIWFGQSVNSRNLGDFPRNKVSMKNATHAYCQTAKKDPSPSEHKRDISCPITGSFIHTGHGDIREHKCWGHVDHIDEIYLKNPLVTQGTGTNSEQKVAIVPSLLMLDQKWCGVNLADHSVDCHLLSNLIYSKTPTEDHKLAGDQNDPKNEKNRRMMTDEFTGNLTRSTMGIERPSEELSREIATVQSQQQRKHQIPAPQPNPNKFNQRTRVTVVKSKYDSAISVPRPNRFSTNRLTPPPISAANFVVGNGDGCFLTASSFLEPTISAVSSMPSVIDDKGNLTDYRVGQFPTKMQRPTSTHSLNGRETTQKTPRHNDDPFWVKEDVKTLTSKLRYNDVYKANEFHLLDKIELKSDRANLSNGIAKSFNLDNIQQNNTSSSNIAVVQPFQNVQAEAVNDRLPAVSAPHSKHLTMNNTKPLGSLLPPPSELLLSGLATQMRPTDDPLRRRPLFDISSLSPFGGPYLRYGTNGIPILEPIPISMPMNSGVPKCQPNARLEECNGGVPISLSELNTDALINRVKVSADFASFEQCRQILWRNGFDADAAIKQLKIEKLIEMGLATDQHIAMSALDSEKWDVNAAANRLCCP